MTPGAYNPEVSQANIGSTICASGWTASIRPPSSYTTSLKAQQIGLYGYADTSMASYEEDHLIPLELGGAPRDPRNLWPEPWAISMADGRSTGARVKDAYETALKRLVCAGTITLADARAKIGVHWAHYYYGLPIALAPSSPTAWPATPRPTVGPTTTAAAPTPITARLVVTITSLTSPVGRGASASLTARTSPAASCTITVVYKSGPSTAQGLGPKSADGAGGVTWTWTVGTRTTLGSWPVMVRCSRGGSSASATTQLVVL